MGRRKGSKNKKSRGALKKFTPEEILDLSKEEEQEIKKR